MARFNYFHNLLLRFSLLFSCCCCCLLFVIVILNFLKLSSSCQLSGKYILPSMSPDVLSKYSHYNFIFCSLILEFFHKFMYGEIELNNCFIIIDNPWFMVFAIYFVRLLYSKNGRLYARDVKVS